MQEPEAEIVVREWQWWPQVRRVLVLQIKLYVDAFRDVCISLLAFVALVLDLVQRNSGEDSHFDRLMKFGRRTEVKINLFGSYDASLQSGRTVDTILDDIEDRLRP